MSRFTRPCFYLKYNLTLRTFVGLGIFLSDFAFSTVIATAFGAVIAPLVMLLCTQAVFLVYFWRRLIHNRQKFVSTCMNYFLFYSYLP